MKRARRILVFALTLLLLFSGIGVSAALAAGTEGETAVPAVQTPAAGGLTVVENNEITVFEENVPLAAGPVEESCCILHLIIMLCALAVTLYYTHDRKKRQKEEFETLFQLI